MDALDNLIDAFDSLPTHAKMLPDDHRRDHRNVDNRMMKRWLTSQVGKNWNTVYSAFRRKFKCETDAHLRYLHWNVELDTFMEDGNVMMFSFLGNAPQKITDFANTCDVLYVHPESNILCIQLHKKIDYNKLHREEEAKTLRILGPWHQLQKYSGIWYEIQVFGMTEEIWKGKKHTPVWYRVAPGPKDRLDFHHPTRFRWALEAKYFTGVFSYTKKQLSHKELKAHGLKNS